MQQRNHLVGKRIQRHAVGILRLTRCQFGLYLRRYNFNHFHLVFQQWTNGRCPGVQGRFGGTVGWRSRKGHKCQAGRDVDQRRIGLTAEMIDHGVGEAHWPNNIGFDHPLCITDITPGSDLFRTENTGIVNQNIDVGMISNHLLYKAVNRVRRGNVQRIRRHAFATGNGILQYLLASTGDNDVVTPIVPALGQCQSNAGTAAGNQKRIARAFHSLSS